MANYCKNCFAEFDCKYNTKKNESCENPNVPCEWCGEKASVCICDKCEGPMCETHIYRYPGLKVCPSCDYV